MDVAGLPARLKARLARGRAAAEARMGAANGGSDAVVQRFIGYTHPDPFNEISVPEYADVHDGPMRLGSANRGAGASRTVATPGGGEVTLATRVASWAAGTPPFEDGDIIRITAGESAGTSWVVVEADRADQETAYRVPVVAHTEP